MKPALRWAALAAIPVLCSACTSDPSVADERPAIRAFPTADGFGAFARGGRGGAVHQVTTLADSGAGSLRACIESQGPRTCVFRVGGEIILESSLKIRNPYITIAGQTAPGGGITLRNHPANVRTPLVVYDAHDVVIRYLRSRPGPAEVPSSNLDAVEVLGGARDVILDHLSLSWSVDELFSIYPIDGRHPDRITLQWSLLAEGLDKSNHLKSEHHSKAMLIVSGIDSDNYSHYSVHHNLLAHNRDRMPEASINGLIDVTNNVVYNPISEFGEFWTKYGDVDVNYVGNVLKKGPSTRGDQAAVNLKMVDETYGFRVHMVDNLTTGLALGTIAPDDRPYLVADPLPSERTWTTSARQAYDDVLNDAGSVIPFRDGVDRRIVAEVLAGEGMVIDHPDEVGAWPYLPVGEAPADIDRDGMPDDWENMVGLLPTDPTDGNGDCDGDGYTNLEDFLNHLSGDVEVPVICGQAGSKE